MHKSAIWVTCRFNPHFYQTWRLTWSRYRWTRRLWTCRCWQTPSRGSSLPGTGHTHAIYIVHLSLSKICCLSPVCVYNKLPMILREKKRILKLNFFFFFFSFPPQGKVSLSTLRFCSTLFHNDPAAHQDHCGRCLVRYQWATTSTFIHHIYNGSVLVEKHMLLQLILLYSSDAAGFSKSRLYIFSGAPHPGIVL